MSVPDRRDSAPPQEGRSSSPSIAGAAAAITDISERVLGLVREEIELAKSEVSEKVSSLLSGAAVAAAAGAFVIGALMLLLIGLSLLVSYLLPVETSEFFWGFFVVAFVLLLLAALAAYIAARAVRAGAPPTPDMAVEEARLIRGSVGSGSGLEALPDGGSQAARDPVHASEAAPSGERAANPNLGDGSDDTTHAN